MSPQAGSRLGPYELLAPIGAGGMGEVWRGKDTRLDRSVAVKILPAAFAEDEERRQRFEREAKAISSLNHPHICTLFDVGHEGDAHFLVMELLEGEVLADRLQKGPLPLDQVVKLGAQVADALTAAHKQGIVHRDLKPGNVVLTKTGAKLLDFGLARTGAGLGGPSGSTELPTEMKPLTTAGTILGTFQYMAPEQLEGAEADARTDIFALGALLYEMATARRAFEGKSKTSLIAAILASQPPPISSVQPVMPPALDHVVKKCLEKDPDDRWQSAHDVASELRWIGEAGSQAGVPATLSLRRRSRERLAWGLAALLAAATAGLAVRPPATPGPADRGLPRHARAARREHADPVRRARHGPVSRREAARLRRDRGRRQQEDLGPRPQRDDGPPAAGDIRGVVSLLVARRPVPRLLCRREAEAHRPARRVAAGDRGGAFRARRQLGRGRRHPLLAEPPLGDSPRSRPSGGTPAPVTRFDPRRRRHTAGRISFRTAGTSSIRCARARPGQARGRPAHARLARLSDETQLLIDDATNAAYVEPGYLLYGRSGNLYAWRFDAGSRRLIGQPVPVVEEKLSLWEPKDLAVLSASDSGTIVYLPEAVPKTTLQWYDAGGRALGTLGAPGFYATPRISPDGKKVAFGLVESNRTPSDLWILDLQYERTFRLTQKSGSYFGACLVPRLEPPGLRLPAQGRPGPLRPVAARRGRRRSCSTRRRTGRPPAAGCPTASPSSSPSRTRRRIDDINALSLGDEPEAARPARNALQRERSRSLAGRPVDRVRLGRNGPRRGQHPARLGVLRAVADLDRGRLAAALARGRPGAVLRFARRVPDGGLDRDAARLPSGTAAKAVSAAGAAGARHARLRGRDARRQALPAERAGHRPLERRLPRDRELAVPPRADRRLRGASGWARRSPGATLPRAKTAPRGPRSPGRSPA